MGPDRKHSDYIEEVGWCYYKTAFYHLLKGCVHWECSLIIGKTNTVTIVRKIEKCLWEHSAVSFTSVPGKQVLTDTTSKHKEGKKSSGSAVTYLPRANSFSNDQITFLFESASSLSKEEHKGLLFHHHIIKVFNTIFHSILVAQLERYDLDGWL